MQFLKINNDTTLSELADIVGNQNVEYILSANNLPRTPRVGKAFQQICDQIVSSNGLVSSDRKIILLNNFTQDSDVFETAALSSSDEWKIISNIGTFLNTLKIPETISISDSADVLGNGIHISSAIYKKAIEDLKTYGEIDPGIFNEYSTIKHSAITEYSKGKSDTFQWFRIPWGDVTLYSSLSDDSIDFPVYPEEVPDNIKANYTQMPDLLYQYEPWNLYQSSGPRSNTYSFHIHRDMWTGNHTDGKANELIRFCQANCYPAYNGSAVNVSTVTLYVKGSPLISGVVTDVSTTWDGPIGSDGWYLNFKLDITITEVSDQALDYHTMRRKGLIG